MYKQYEEELRREQAQRVAREQASLTVTAEQKETVKLFDKKDDEDKVPYYNRIRTYENTLHGWASFTSQTWNRV